MQDVAEFERLTNEDSLNDTHYPQSECISTTILGASPDTHPLHPDFKIPPPIPERRGLLGGIISLGWNPTIDIDKLRADQALRVGMLWSRVRNHPVYTWLCAHENFNSALRTYEKKKKFPAEGTTYRHPYSDFRFFWCAGVLVGSFVAAGCKASPQPDAREKGQAIGHIDKLLTDINERGVRLTDYAKNRTLVKYLEELREHLRQTREIIAPRDDKTRGLRELIARLALFMSFYFRDASPAIISKLIAISGKTLEEKTVITHIKDALTP